METKDYDEKKKRNDNHIEPTKLNGEELGQFYKDNFDGDKEKLKFLEESIRVHITSIEQIKNKTEENYIEEAKLNGNKHGQFNTKTLDSDEEKLEFLYKELKLQDDFIIKQARREGKLKETQLQEIKRKINLKSNGGINETINETIVELENKLHIYSATLEEVEQGNKYRLLRIIWEEAQKTRVNLLKEIKLAVKFESGDIDEIGNDTWKTVDCGVDEINDKIRDLTSIGRKAHDGIKSIEQLLKDGAEVEDSDDIKKHLKVGHELYTDFIEKVLEKIKQLQILQHKRSGPHPKLIAGYQKGGVLVEQRINKMKEKQIFLEGQIEESLKMLENKDFLSKTPKDVIEKEHEKYLKLKEELELLKSRIKNLK